MQKSFQTVTEEKDITRKAKELCVKGGFNFTKFASNTEEVVKSIPNKDRRNNVTDEELAFGKLPGDKALGVKWKISKDTLGFQTKMTENPSWKCWLLSVLAALWSSWFGSSIFAKGKIDHSTVTQRQTRPGSTSRVEVILWMVEVEKYLGGNGEYQCTKMLQTNWLWLRL